LQVLKFGLANFPSFSGSFTSSYSLKFLFITPPPPIQIGSGTFQNSVPLAIRIKDVIRSAHVSNASCEWTSNELRICVELPILIHNVISKRVEISTTCTWGRHTELSFDKQRRLNRMKTAEIRVLKVLKTRIRRFVVRNGIVKQGILHRTRNSVVLRMIQNTVTFRSSMINNNGFWITWLHLLTPSFTITLNYNHNSSQSMTAKDSLHSLLDYEPLLYSLSSIVTDLVLIYESLTNELRITNDESLMNEWRFKVKVKVKFKDDSESYITTDGQSASLSWNKAPMWGSQQDFYYCQTVAGLLMWGALSDERTCLPFTITAGPRQRSHFRVRVPVGLVTIFYCLRFEASLFVASYYSQGYGGGIRPRLPAQGWHAKKNYQRRFNYMSPLYNFGAKRIQTTTPNGFSVPIRCCGNVPSDPLSSNGRLWGASLTAFNMDPH
jgi:hypothetical protein